MKRKFDELQGLLIMGLAAIITSGTAYKVVKILFNV